MFHKLECAAIQRWSDASRKTEGDAPVVPADAIRCLARMVWRKQKLGAESAWVCASPLLWGWVVMFLIRLKRLMLWNPVSSFVVFASYDRCRLEADRTSLSKDPNSQNSQMYAQLAHALVNFLGIASPQDMAAYALKSAADLVDLISRVRGVSFQCI